MENKETTRRPDWVFSSAFALTTLAFLAWLVWYTVTRTSATFP